MHLKTITKEELKEKIRLHGEWLKDTSKGERLVLVGYDLSYYNLKGYNLRRSNFRHSDLSYSDLSGSDLRRSDFRGSDLRGSDLRGSDFRGSDLSGSNLSNSDLSNSNLSNSNLGGSNLNDSYIIGTDLDFSCFPLWCGGKNIKTCSSLPKMLAAFICSMKCDDKETKEFQKMALNYARKSHRAIDILGEN